MSTGQYTHVTKVAGTIVTAPLYNTAHQNQLNNDIPTSAGAHSDDLTQFRATTDPTTGDGTTALPVIALGEELEQLRFVIADVKQRLNGGVPVAHWYSPVSPNNTLKTAYGARVFRAAAQNIFTGSFTSISFSGTRWDNPPPGYNNFFTSGTRLTAPVDGIYQVGAFAEWPAFGTGGKVFALALKQNGSTFLSESKIGTDGVSDARWMEVGTQIKLLAGDYVEFFVLQNANATVNITGCEMWMMLLAPTSAIAPVFFLLSITESGTGTGSVSSSPAGIACPGTCSANFAAEASVMLSATAAVGSVFVQWSGNVPIGHEMDNPLTITMTAAKTIDAQFNLATSVVIMGAQVNDVVDNAGDDRVGFDGLVWNSVASAESASPLAFTAKDLRIRIGAALAGSEVLVMTLVVNGVDSGIVCTFNSGTGQSVQASGSQAIADGDRIYVKAVLSGGLASSTIRSISLSGNT